MARTDDVLNVAGHRLSSGALEEAVCLHPDVAEAAVVGVKDNFKGQVWQSCFGTNAENFSRSLALNVDMVLFAALQEFIVMCDMISHFWLSFLVGFSSLLMPSMAHAL